MDLVSVIIPVYNAEAHLHECIDSILNQSYQNLEIILVDDGSTDQSGAICDEYALKDKRVKVIHKTNSGPSGARNTGLDICSGKWISFIDSDDYISPYFVEALQQAAAANDCDIAALSGGVNFWEDDQTAPELALDAESLSVKVCSVREAVELMLYLKIANGTPWKFSKSNVWKEIRFPTNIFMAEDVITTYKAFTKANQIAIAAGPYYARRKRMDSISRQNFSQKKLCVISVYKQLVGDPLINQWGLLKAAEARSFDMLYNVFLQIPKEDRTNLDLVWTNMKDLRRSVVVNHSPQIRRKTKYGAWVSYLGMQAAWVLGRKFGQKGSFR